MKLGVWALVVVLVAVLYVGAGIALALLGLGSSGSDSAATVAYVMFFAGFVVVPLCLLAGLVLGVAALILNRVAGKVLGGIAIALLAAVGAVGVIAVSGSSGPLGL